MICPDVHGSPEPAQVGRLLARVAARTVLGEHRLAAIELRLACGQYGGAAGCVLEAVGLRGLAGRTAPCPASGWSSPANRRSSSRVGDPDRRDLLAADQRPEVQQPFLAEQADVDEDAVERTQRADRIGAVLEHVRREHGVGRLERPRQRLRLRVVLELLVVERAAGASFSGNFRAASSRGSTLYTAFIVRGLLMLSVDTKEVSSEPGSEVWNSWKMKLACDVLRVPHEDAVDPEILRARDWSSGSPIWDFPDPPADSPGSARRGRSRMTCRRGRAGPGPCRCSIWDRCNTRASRSLGRPISASPRR